MHNFMRETIQEQNIAMAETFTNKIKIIEKASKFAESQKVQCN